MTKPQIHCIIGISSSGKSTTARNLVKYAETPTVIVERKNLIQMLFGYTEETFSEYFKRSDFNHRQLLVLDSEEKLVRQYLQEGFSVVLDSTHLTIQSLYDLQKYNTPVNTIEVHCPVVTAIERDSFTSNPVGIDVIMYQHQQLEHLKKAYNFGNSTKIDMETQQSI